jgi:hypothetical protein
MDEPAPGDQEEADNGVSLVFCGHPEVRLTAYKV